MSSECEHTTQELSGLEVLSDCEHLIQELTGLEVLLEKEKEKQSFELIERERLLDRPYKEVLEKLVGEHAIIADCSNYGAAKTVSLDDLVISRQANIEDTKMIPRKAWTTKLVMDNVIINGNLSERDAEVKTVTLYDEISDLTAFSKMRYFAEAAITTSKTNIFLLKEGQLLQIPRVKELVQIIALCLAPPTRKDGHPIFLIVWADPRLEYVI